MQKTTESDSLHHDLEHLSPLQILQGINEEDRKIADAVASAIPQVEALTGAFIRAIESGGRVFYIGAGTSGRLGIVDASELPPTYGVPHGLVIGLIAGGDQAIRKAVEFAEDDESGAWNDLMQYDVSTKDLVIGIAASGTTPYVTGGLQKCREAGMVTGCITCNENAPVIQHADYPVVVITGPEFVTGSTRMKAGTAQKLVLNMISTTAMIKLGHVQGNKMVDMQLTNHKLIDRGTRMVMEKTGLPYDAAKKLLEQHGNVRKAVETWKREHHP